MNSSLDLHTSDLSREWLETDGLGGFASGTATGIRTRRYHALLLAATTPPTGRLVLVNGFDARIETPAGRFDLTSQYYAPDVIGGSGAQHIEQFTSQPWPRWIFKFADGTRIEQEILVAANRNSRKSAGACSVSGKAFGSSCDRSSPAATITPCTRRTDAVRFDAAVEAERVVWNPYPGVPASSRCQMVTTNTSRTGIATSATLKKPRVVLMTRRTSQLPTFSISIWPPARRC